MHYDSLFVIHGFLTLAIEMHNDQISHMHTHTHTYNCFTAL